MNIIDKNEGTKVQYKLTGTKISFRNSELTIDLSRYQQDFPVHLDISADAYGMLTMGTARRYVAQIDIPAREYRYESDGVDDEGQPKQKKTAVPFDPEDVTLTLWTEV